MGIINLFIIVQISDKNSVTLGYNDQVNYYVSSESMKEAVFSFNSSGNNIGADAEATFWVKGKNIINATMKGFSRNQYDHGYVFYGPLKSQGNELTVNCEVGDYITVGSIIINNNKTKEIKENSNEIMVVSNKEICIPVQYDKDFSFITGKIYNTDNAEYRFTDSEKITKEFKDEKTEGVITNGIISIMNFFGFMIQNKEQGLLCLKDANNQLKSSSIYEE